MSDLAIRAENLSKRYQIATARTRHDTLRDQVTQGLRNLVRRNGRSGQTGAETIWALKDVSFEVKQGEVVGLIGRNGAGKSTLLKILTRITEPTTGHAEIYGRVGSLLEVGTGFHSELSGRDNIYLSGAILGMKKAEINRKFDEIVAFAEIDRFIDTPVKHYSSGMHMRLAFAVAAHLDPEILLVDEVLAVGDAAFQKKCLGKMGEAAKGGRTVLFVSHNMGAITQLCRSSFLVQRGRIAAQGPSREIVEQYLANMFSTGTIQDLTDAPGRSGDGRLRFQAVYLRNEHGRRTDLPIAGRPVDIVLEFDSRDELSLVQFELTIFNQAGTAVTNCNVDAYGERLPVPRGKGRVICHIPRLPLPSSRYKVAVAAQDDKGELDWVPTGCVFDVETSEFYPTPYLPPVEYSAALVEHSWVVATGGDQ